MKHKYMHTYRYYPHASNVTVLLFSSLNDLPPLGLRPATPSASDQCTVPCTDIWSEHLPICSDAIFQFSKILGLLLVS